MCGFKDVLHRKEGIAHRLVRTCIRCATNLFVVHLLMHGTNKLYHLPFEIPHRINCFFVFFIILIRQIKVTLTGNY